MPEGRSMQDVQAHWLAETLRLREALWGPVEDAAEVRRVRADGGELTRKILLRAHYLGQREQHHELLIRWRRGARIALLLLALVAMVAGGAAALGALGDGTRPVNLVLALVGTLGLNLLALLFWLMSFLIGDSAGGSWLGESWLWLTRKLARGPDAALVPRALVGLLARNRSLRWLLGAVSHGWWSLATGSLLLTLLAMLSARRYQFNWETTVLSPDAFVWLTSALGWLPARLGFPMPTEAMIRASDGLQQVPDATQALWSGWLLGCIVVYGLLPRLICLALSAWRTKARLANLELDVGLPGYAELRERLAPSSERSGVDAPEQPGYQSRVAPHRHAASVTGEHVAIGIELPADMPPPLAPFPAGAIDLGVLDSRSERKAMLDRLQTQRPQRLLMVCDARQTPDRGVIALLVELTGLAAEAAVALARSDSLDGSRTSAWRERLLAAGFTIEQIHTDITEAAQWLISGKQALAVDRGPHDAA